MTSRNVPDRRTVYLLTKAIEKADESDTLKDHTYKSFAQMMSDELNRGVSPKTISGLAEVIGVEWKECNSDKDINGLVDAILNLENMVRVLKSRIVAIEERVFK